jgi:hypothetical protein
MPKATPAKQTAPSTTPPTNPVPIEPRTEPVAIGHLAAISGSIAAVHDVLLNVNIALTKIADHLGRGIPPPTDNRAPPAKRARSEQVSFRVGDHVTVQLPQGQVAVGVVIEVSPLWLRVKDASETVHRVQRPYATRLDPTPVPPALPPTQVPLPANNHPAPPVTSIASAQPARIGVAPVTFELTQFADAGEDEF